MWQLWVEKLYYLEIKFVFIGNKYLINLQSTLKITFSASYAIKTNIVPTFAAVISRM